MVSLNHANFISNEASATSSDILDLSMDVRDEVWNKTGVWLEYEMEILGSISPSQKKRLSEKKEQRVKHNILEKLRKEFNS